MSTLDRLRGAYADRPAEAARWRADGRPVVGYVGADVPVELLTAVGAVPLRLAGDPDRDLTPGVRYLGEGVDPVASSVLSGLLAGAYPIDHLVVSRDCEASLRLFYAVRELRRTEPGLGLPETYLVDIGHLPHRTTTAYNTVRIGQLRDRLADWFGPVDEAALASAVAVHDEQRALLTTVSGCRPALSGVDFLAVVGAGAAMPVAEHRTLLDALVSELDGAVEVMGRRAFVTGSSHDHDQVYRRIEEDGMVVVGEDHDWGELWFARLVGPVGDGGLVEALAERYQYNGPTAHRATVAERAAYTAGRVAACGAEVLVCYARRADDAPRWDFARQAGASAVATVMATGQRYGGYAA